MTTQKLPAMSIAEMLAAVKAAQLAGKDASALDPLLGLKIVSPVAGLGKTAIYKRIKEGTFPAPVRLSQRASRWRLSEIARWLEQQTSEIPPARGAK